MGCDESEADPNIRPDIHTWPICASLLMVPPFFSFFLADLVRYFPIGGSFRTRTSTNTFKCPISSAVYTTPRCPLYAVPPSPARFRVFPKPLLPPPQQIRQDSLTHLNPNSPPTPPKGIRRLRPSFVLFHRTPKLNTTPTNPYDLLSFSIGLIFTTL